MMPLHLLPAGFSWGRRFTRWTLLGWLVGLGAFPSGLRAEVAVLTYHNDNARTGQNLAETILTLDNVSSSTFGKVAEYPVDGHVYAQPLILTNVAIAGQGRGNLLFIATQHNSVYAFNADPDGGGNTPPIWKTSFINPDAGITSVPNLDVGSTDIVPEVGITSTPVIDPATGTLYVSAKSKEVVQGVAHYIYRLHALDAATGQEKFGGPVVMGDTVLHTNGTYTHVAGPSLPGIGFGSVNGRVHFNALRQLNRPALVLADGVVYIAFGSHGDHKPYHGWVLGYDARTLALKAVYNTSRNLTKGGIWQSGQGPAVDANGSLYVMTGDGSFHTNYPSVNSSSLGNSFIRFSTENGLEAVDYFTPFNQELLNQTDKDLGSGGVLILPDSVGSAEHRRLLVGCGKEGTIYLLDRDWMGHYRSDNDGRIVQSLPKAVGGTWGSPAYFNQHIYYAGAADVMKSFHISNGRIDSTPRSVSTTRFGWPGATPCISANGSREAIVWVLRTDGHSVRGPAVLHAYNATNLAQELYNSAQAGVRDQLGRAVKFTIPTIANGRVYVGTQSGASVFGLRGAQVAPPVIAPAGGTFTNSLIVRISTPTPGAAIYYTLDESVPTTNALRYADPLTISNSLTVTAKAFKSGLLASGTASASFVNSSGGATSKPPAVRIVSPANGSQFTAPASLSIWGDASLPGGSISRVDLYLGDDLLGGLTARPYSLTTVGLSEGTYRLSAVAWTGAGAKATSAVVSVSVKPPADADYGLEARGSSPAYFNMPRTSSGTPPSRLSQTGLFADTARLKPGSALIPYTVNTPLWSDGALQTRWMAVPNDGPPYAQQDQIIFASHEGWRFPSGSIFVMHFELPTDETQPEVIRRLETRILVRDNRTSVYGVTYKWRPDNSDADRLSGSVTENIVINTANGRRTQAWYYPSPADCLTCHTPQAGYVLGVNTRQLNGGFTYSNGVSDNQLRSLNRLGLLYPAFDEAAIQDFPQLSALHDQDASLEERARSYLDANCAQCHRPDGSSQIFDARYHTPLDRQNLVNVTPQKGDLGVDNPRIIKPKDIWRSVLLLRMDTTNPLAKMPPLACNRIDTNAVKITADWINSLPGTPALAPPTIAPNGGAFNSPVSVTVRPPNAQANMRYTLDDSLPSDSSPRYTGPITLNTTTTLSVAAFANGFDRSVAARARFILNPAHQSRPPYFTGSGYFDQGVFQLPLSATEGSTYVLENTADLIHWTPLSTNQAPAPAFELTDPKASHSPLRFYRLREHP